jgi:hypothetical protein
MSQFRFALVLCGLFSLLGNASAQAASPEHSAPAAQPSVVERVEKAVVRGAKAAASGVERGLKAANSGVEHGLQAASKGGERGARAAASGVERGAKATGNAVQSVAKKVGVPAAAASQAGK